MIFRNARLILTDRISPRGELRVENGHITGIADQPLEPAPGEEILDLGGQFLAPGFIDMHIHGALRRDTMEADPEAFETICRHHATGGTTSLALTTVTAPAEAIVKVLDAVAAYRQQKRPGAQVLGVHLEGPYFSPQKPGAHAPELLRTPQRSEWSRFLQDPRLVTQMTLAPELPGAIELIDALVQLGIRVSGGHSDAWDEDAATAFAHGMRHATHTFNCMSSARHRGPYRVAGLLEFALSEPDMLCELIADGRHVSPTLMRMLYLAKGPDGIALITDASAGAGLPEESSFILAGMGCVVRDSVGLTGDGRALAGSTATMIRCVANMVNLTGIPLFEAVRMATLNPARALGLDSHKGSLSLGSHADLVAFNDQFEVSNTWIAGKALTHLAEPQTPSACQS